MHARLAQGLDRWRRQRSAELAALTPWAGEPSLAPGLRSWADPSELRRISSEMYVGARALRAEARELLDLAREIERGEREAAEGSGS